MLRRTLTYEPTLGRTTLGRHSLGRMQPCVWEDPFGYTLTFRSSEPRPPPLLFISTLAPCSLCSCVLSVLLPFRVFSFDNIKTAESVPQISPLPATIRDKLSVVCCYASLLASSFRYWQRSVYFKSMANYYEWGWLSLTKVSMLGSLGCRVSNRLMNEVSVVTLLTGSNHKLLSLFFR